MQRKSHISKTGFIPIALDQYISRHLESNPDEKREIITQRLKDALEAYKRNETCSCGQPLWVIGSAAVAYGCFTCITGEAVPDSDYEIDEACE